jgi:DNA-binding CsgD family transcriptional regulator
MGGRRRNQARFRPDKIGDFLDAVYDLECDEDDWLVAILAAARAVCGRTGPGHAVSYDGSRPGAFQVLRARTLDFSEAGLRCLRASFGMVSSELAARSFLSLLTHNSVRRLSSPELDPLFDGMGALGSPDCLGINGLDPEGRGVILGIWVPEPHQPGSVEAAAYRRMAHHLGAGHRCRRRLRATLAADEVVKPTAGAEAILDTRLRFVHAEGDARRPGARAALARTAAAREQTRKRGADTVRLLPGWRPLTDARWTLVDSFETGGKRYIVARENQPRRPGLASLTERERQVVHYLALGQSTKETAYALGISDATVRVLLARAAVRLGVRSRAELLRHPEVRLLRAE